MKPKVRNFTIGAVASVLLVLMESVLISQETVRAKQNQPPPIRKLVLRVTSVKANQEVRFKGSILASGEKSKLETFDRSTPFEYITEARLLNAMFQTESQDGIKVVLLGPPEEKKDGELQEYCSGTGQTLVIGENLDETVPRMVLVLPAGNGANK